MRYLIFGFILLLLAIGLGLEMAQDTGYVLFVYNHWSVETSLWVAVVSCLVLFIVLYIIFRVLGQTFRISKKIRRWKKMRRYRHAKQLTDIGLCELAEGNWHVAEHTLIKASKMTKRPLINYLAAARAAQAQQAYERRDNYLRKAHLTTKNANIAVGLTQAQLQIAAHQWEQALATLTHLNHTDPHHLYILQLLKSVYHQLNDWEHLQKMLPSLRKHHVFSQEELLALEQKIYLALLHSANHKSTAELLEIWNTLPRRWQQDIILIRAYTQYLIQHHEETKAIPMIETVLKKEWDAILVHYYGQMHGDTPAKQLITAETWLKKYPKEPELLLCLGRLSRREKFWGKARDYIDACITLSPSRAAYEQLGHVLEALDDKTAALEAYRQGLNM